MRCSILATAALAAFCNVALAQDSGTPMPPQLRHDGQVFEVPQQQRSAAGGQGQASQSLRQVERRAGFTCNPLFCACSGDADCNDMFSTTICGPRAICIDDVCYCVR